jgi:hypothetical protein
MACGILTLGLSAIALQHLTPSVFEASQHQKSNPTAQASQNPLQQNLLQAVQQESLRQESLRQESWQQVEKRPVYPYSVVDGGVRDTSELKRAVLHDPVVARHYAGFDFNHARMVRLLLGRSAYVAYRIGNRVYWTKHRVKLQKGEMLITDGKMVARTRCANRVEEVPQQETSKAEPAVEKFEEPIHPATGTAVANPPVVFESALLNRNGVPGLGPAPPLTLYDPMNGGELTPIAPPPLPSVCGFGTKKPSTGGTPPVNTGSGKKKRADPCGAGGGGGGEVPEPGTWLLVASGLALMYWKARQKFART